MPSSTRLIRRRIKSIRNTRKITKAMELVAASKMRRAVQAVLASRPFASLAFETIQAVGAKTDVSLHPLLRQSASSSRVLLVLLTSDRGLAGGFNTNMVKRAAALIREQDPKVAVDLVTIGRRGADAMRRQNRNMVASFTNLGETPRFESVLPLVKLVIDGFSDGTYDRVFLAYTDFISALRQQPKVLPLLPLTFEALSQSAVDPDGTPSAHHPPKGEYLFEPDSHAVLDRLLPRVVEMMLYQAVLESSASEHSARMMTMRTASDAASDMINDLSFTFNQMRQAGITREIAEISGGKAALEGGNCTRVIGDRL